jgi:hypothetical protein
MLPRPGSALRTADHAHEDEVHEGEDGGRRPEEGPHPAAEAGHGADAGTDPRATASGRETSDPEVEGHRPQDFRKLPIWLHLYEFWATASEEDKAIIRNEAADALRFAAAVKGQANPKDYETVASMVADLFGLRPGTKPMTVKDIAAKYGMGQKRVKKLARAAIRWEDNAIDLKHKADDLAYAMYAKGRLFLVDVVDHQDELTALGRLGYA